MMMCLCVCMRVRAHAHARVCVHARLCQACRSQTHDPLPHTSAVSLTCAGGEVGGAHPPLHARAVICGRFHTMAILDEAQVCRLSEFMYAPYTA